MLGLYMGQALVLSEHEDKVQNRYKEKTYTSQTLWYSCQMQAKQNARKSWEISLSYS